MASANGKCQFVTDTSIIIFFNLEMNYLLSEDMLVDLEVSDKAKLFQVWISLCLSILTQ